MTHGILRVSKPILLTATIVLLLLAAPMLTWAQTDLNPEFLGYVADIAEDMEHIHDDMHTVAFGIRLGAYALVVIAIAQVLSLLLQLKKGVAPGVG
jgi:hypothetical protein